MSFVAFGILLTVYCIFEYKAEEAGPAQLHRSLWRTATVLKVSLSLFIAAWAWALRIQGAAGVFPTLMAVGLTWAVAADYFLQYIDRDEKRYSAGILCFALMHLSLLAAFFLRFGIHPQEFVFFVFLLGCVIRIQKVFDGEIKSQRNLLSAYTVLVVLMASKALSAALLEPSLHTFFLGLAGECFLASDIILGFWAYRTKTPALAVANRIVYFCGQFFFACSVALLCGHRF